MSTAEFNSAENLTSPISYQYYSDFENWGGSQIPMTLLGTAAGVSAGFTVSELLHEPYANFEWNLQTLKEDRAFQTSKRQIQRDTKEIAYAIQHQPQTIIHKPEIAAITLGGGPVLGVLTAIGVLKTRRWLHERRRQRIEEASARLRQTLELVEALDKQFSL